MLSLSRMGPLMTIAVLDDVVDPKSPSGPKDAMASTTGKNSGLHPAITAFTATCLTVYPHREEVYPTPWTGVLSTSSGWWLVAFSIASTFSSVGMMIGM